MGEKGIPISLAIIAFNEAHNIERCIRSAKAVCEEIVVVDSGSTDGTPALAEALGAKVVFHPFEGHIEQKNFAIEQCNHDWVLSLDADEALNETLLQAILIWKSSGKEGTPKGFTMNRLSSYCGHWVRHCGWYPDRKLRLFDKRVAHWGGYNPHDKVILQDDLLTQHLPGDILHYTYNSISEHLRQVDYFTTILAEGAFKKGKQSTIAYTISSSVFKFFRDYIIKQGFRDGYYGFVISAISAFATFVKHLKIRELQRKS